MRLGCWHWDAPRRDGNVVLWCAPWTAFWSTRARFPFIWSWGHERCHPRGTSPSACSLFEAPGTCSFLPIAACPVPWGPPLRGVCPRRVPRLAGCTAAKSPDRLRLRLGSTCLARSALRQSAQSACGGRSAHMRRRGRPASIASCFSSAWPLHAVPGGPSACHNLQALQLAVEPC